MKQKILHLKNFLAMNKTVIVSLAAVSILAVMLLTSAFKLRLANKERDSLAEQVNEMIVSHQKEILQKDSLLKVQNCVLQKRGDSIATVIIQLEQLRIKINKKYDNEITKINHLTPSSRTTYLDSLFRANGIR
jgi:hypothetical protein